MSDQFRSQHPEGSTAYYADAIDWITRLVESGQIGPATGTARLLAIEHELATALWRPHALDLVRSLRGLARSSAHAIAIDAGFDARDALELSFDERATPDEPDAWCVEGCGRRRRARAPRAGRPPTRCAECHDTTTREQGRHRTRQHRENH